MFSMEVERPPLGVFGVGHPEQPLPSVRRSDARSTQIGSPDFIAHSFQVSSYSSEPFTSKLARNLLSKRDCRLSVSNKLFEYWPEVALVCFATLLPGLTEWLAGTGAGPDRLVVWPSGKSQSE